MRCLQAQLSKITAYPDPSYADLRFALANHHQIGADWILPGNGSAELLTWACRELASLERVVVVQPGFGDYARSLSAFSARPHSCALVFDPRHWLEKAGSSVNPAIADLNVVVPELLELQAHHPSTQGLLLNNPHNPTGMVFSRDSILRYLDRFALVVVDEAFMDFLPPDQQQSLMDWVTDYPHLVILRSLTKFFSLPGLRLGYAIVHPDRLQRWQAWRDPWPVNTLAAAAGIAALEDRAFQSRTWNWMATEQPRLFQGLADISGLEPLPSGANFFLVAAQTPVPDLQLRLLRHAKVLIRDCLSFPDLGDRYFRVAVRTEAENDRLLEGLRSQLRS
jgi:L-threonine-O-3-phosphate decarboxylase